MHGIFKLAGYLVAGNGGSCGKPGQLVLVETTGWQ